MDSQDSQFMQILYEIALLDTFDCINYGLVVNEHIVDSVKSLVEMDVASSLLSLGLAVHKSPVAYRECLKVYTDTSAMWDTFGSNFSLPLFIGNIGLNTFINFAEIYHQGVKGIKALQIGNYTTFGESVGKITSDVFLKNPLYNSWSYNNSDIFTAQLDSSLPSNDFLPQTE